MSSTVEKVDETKNNILNAIPTTLTSMFNSVTSSSSSSSSSITTSTSSLISDNQNKNVQDKSLEEISKDDLIHLCLKMKKRMQAMESKGQEVSKKKATLIFERQSLLKLIEEVCQLQCLNIQDDQDLDINLITNSFKKWDRSRNDELQTLQMNISIKEQQLISGLTSNESKYRKQILELKQSLEIAQNSLSSLATFVDMNKINQHSSNDNMDNNNIDKIDEIHNSVAANNIETSNSILVSELEQITIEKDELQSSVIELHSQCRALDLELKKSILTEEQLRSEQIALRESLSAQNIKYKKFESDSQLLKSQYEEKILYLQIQANTSRGHDNNINEIQALKKQLDANISKSLILQQNLEEKDLAINSGKDVILALQNLLGEMEPELESSRHRIKEFERNHNANAVMKAEQESYLSTMRKDLKSVLDSKDNYLKRIKELEEYCKKLEDNVQKMSLMSEQMALLEVGNEEKASLITRLRKEAQTSERNHGMRTAMLATCEEQLETLRAEKNAHEETVKETIERISVLQLRLSATEARLTERIKEDNHKIELLENEIINNKNFQQEEINIIKKNNEEEIEIIKRDFLKKSNLARTMINEKEEETRVLAIKVNELKIEIASGSPSEKKIFELAQTQAQRDTKYSIHTDTREVAFHQLQSSLALRDLELAKLQQGHADLSAEVSELRRTTRREGVNMDYLKNIVLQYMSFPMQSPERISLVPVIAMLLQFNSKELAEAEQSLKDSLWSTARPVKEVKRNLMKAASYTPSTSSTYSSLNNRSTTSPQFNNSSTILSSLQPSNNLTSVIDSSGLEFETMTI